MSSGKWLRKTSHTMDRFGLTDEDAEDILQDVWYQFSNVLETEPKVERELLQFENVIVTPHVAWFSVEASQKLRRTAVTDILRILSGQKPQYPVPG